MDGDGGGLPGQRFGDGLRGVVTEARNFELGWQWLVLASTPGAPGDDWVRASPRLIGFSMGLAFALEALI